MVLKYNDVQSLIHWMPGGSHQGALLGVLLYIVYVSDIGMDLPLIPPTIPGVIELPSVQFPPPPAVSDQEARLKFVDDLSMCECFRLDTQLISKCDELFLPPNQSQLQKRLVDISTSAESHDMT